MSTGPALRPCQVVMPAPRSPAFKNRLFQQSSRIVFMAPASIGDDGPAGMGSRSEDLEIGAPTHTFDQRADQVRRQFGAVCFDHTLNLPAMERMVSVGPQ